MEEKTTLINGDCLKYYNIAKECIDKENTKQENTQEKLFS
jgi:hypothetical protein